MSKKFFGLLVASLALALLAAGCDTATNTNTNMNTNAATPSPSPTGTNANANANANRAMTREDVKSKANDYLAEAKRLGRKVGAGADDVWIWTKTRSELATAEDLRDSTIEVDVENGVITLTGNVASNEQLKRADAIAKGIDGQKGVQNKLKVAADSGNKNAANSNTKTKKG
ncbi:MAG: BON domain-containing protein [Pyrinomonadaceae bacterium]|nr:BON domain-containing protein [Pyrinomonadaceae bacterium]